VEWVQVGFVLECYLKALHFNVRVLHAGLNARERTDLQDAFNADRDIEILILSAQVGGVGLDLHKDCHVMVLYERCINHPIEDQLRGRLQRYGQRHSPLIYRLLSLGTYDHTMEIKANKKAHSLVSVFRQYGGPLCAQSVEDIQSIYLGWDGALSPDEIAAAEMFLERLS
jgi:SNF2 family DNA or RNA helicase